MSEKHQDSPRLLGFAAAAAILGVIAVWATLPTVEPSRDENTRKLPLAAVPQSELTAESKAKKTENNGNRAAISLCGKENSSGCTSPVLSFTAPSSMETIAPSQPNFAEDEAISQPSETGLTEATEEEGPAQIAMVSDEDLELATLAPAAGPGNPDQSELDRSQPVPPPVVSSRGNTTKSAPRKVYFLVIGSFINPSHAETRRKQFADWKPSVRQKQLKGKSYHRIMLGPYDMANLKQARRRVDKAGVSDHWTLRAPAGDTAQLALMALPEES